MKQRAFLVLSIVLALILLGPNAILAKEIKVLSQFPMSGPVGTLPEFGWGYIDGMNWVNSDGGGIKDIFLHMEGLTYALLIQEVFTGADNAGELTRLGVKKALDNMV